MTAGGRPDRQTTHPAMRSREVLLLRPVDPAGTSFAVPAIPRARRSAGRRVDAWIVMALLVATTLLAVYDAYVLLTFAPG